MLKKQFVRQTNSNFTILLKTQFAFVVIALFGSFSFGSDASPYNFGGVCASQGVWVQEALNNSRQIKQIILKLKDDPNCKGLGAKMDSYLSSLEEELKKIKETDQNVSRLSDIPGELSSLRSVLISNPDQRSQALSLMADRVFESGKIRVQNIVSAMSENQIASISSLGKRLNQSTGAGIGMLSAMLDELPNFQNCLTEANGAGPLLAGAINMAGAFINYSKGSGLGTANLLNRITNLVREDRYATVIRQLNEVEFQNSISCLLESSAEAYCNTMDQRKMAQMALREQIIEKSSSKEQNTQNEYSAAFYGGIKNPYTGLYILSQHIPNISQWLQKIQIGVDPKLPTDADQKNETIELVTTYLQKVNSLKAEYNQQLETLKDPSLDMKSKKNLVLSMVLNLSKEMIAGKSGKNFFLLASNELELPFALIGAPIPDAVRGIGVATAIDPFKYIQMNPDLYFSSPIEKAEAIGSNLNAIVNAADAASIAYYSKWFIVDKASIVSESITSVNYNVLDSFKALKNYLKLLVEKIYKYNGLRHDVPEILSTIDRIEKVLLKYQALLELDARMMETSAYVDIKTGKFTVRDNQKKLKLTDIQRATILNTYTAVVNEVYSQFNVMLSRSGFLANKFQTWVLYDYALMLKNNININEYEKTLMIALGSTVMDRYATIMNGNPATMKDDLDNALRIHKENLLAIEGTFKENWFTYTEVAKLISEGKFTEKEIRNAVETRLEKDSGLFGLPSKYIPPIGTMVSIKALLDIGQIWRRYTQPNLYQMPGGIFKERKYVKDNEMNSMKQVYSKMCIQALAFQDHKLFDSLCKQALLISPYSEVDPLNKKLYTLNMSYNLQKDISKASEAKQKYSGDTVKICSFRDYHRRNLVQKLTIGRPFATSGTISYFDED